MTKFTVKFEALYSEVNGPERVYALYNVLVLCLALVSSALEHI